MRFMYARQAIKAAIKGAIKGDGILQQVKNWSDAISGFFWLRLTFLPDVTDGFCDNFPWPEVSEFSKTRKSLERKQIGTELPEMRLFLNAIPKYMQYFGQKWDVFL